MVRTLLVILLICVLGTIFFSLPVVQTLLAQFATKKINDQYGTHINIERLKVSLISWNTGLEGVYIEDYQQDTLFYVNELKTSIFGKIPYGKLDTLCTLFFMLISI